MSDPNIATLASYVLRVTDPPGTHPEPGRFYDLLVQTMFQADRHNRARLGAGFPVLASMVTAYKDDRYGITRLRRAAETGDWTL